LRSGSKNGSGHFVGIFLLSALTKDRFRQGNDCVAINKGNDSVTILANDICS
jgi:hypothetical protein